MSRHRVELVGPDEQRWPAWVGWDSYTESFYANVHAAGAVLGLKEPAVAPEAALGYRFGELPTTEALAAALAPYGALSSVVEERLEGERVAGMAAAEAEKVAPVPRRPPAALRRELGRSFPGCDIAVVTGLELHELLDPEGRQVAVGVLRVGEPAPAALCGAQRELANGRSPEKVAIEVAYQLHMGKHRPMALTLVLEVWRPDAPCNPTVVPVYLPHVDLEAERGWMGEVRRSGHLGLAIGRMPAHPGESEQILVSETIPADLFVRYGA